MNLYNISYQTITAIQIIDGNNSLIQLDIKSDDVYFSRRSTENRSLPEMYKYRPNRSAAANSLLPDNQAISTLNDEGFMDIMCYESLLGSINTVDHSIISCIVEKQYTKRSMITGDCFLFDTALEYRMKKLYIRLNVTSYAELYQKIIRMSQNIDHSKIVPNSKAHKKTAAPTMSGLLFSYRSSAGFI